ncbi:50S ribosomal protein L11 [Candidatus Saccharibacteria bacterium RIFCSPHIGHO2_12_FULL_41_12]|nr:MAG: 50S ribosomal protein L11 [Candidatus Saccharibacteria bacterium RIFCSPHIGHO2_12_FULL_41_12]
MAEKKIKANLKMKIPAGKASAGPPVGSTLGQYGVSMMDFVNPFNEATRDMGNVTVTAHITVYEDRSMKFRVVGAPTDDLIRAKLGIAKGSGKPNTEKLEQKLSQTDLKSIAEDKAQDMNTDDIESIKKMVAGTARSMGIEVQ